jgi:hypothetical protein
MGSVAFDALAYVRKVVAAGVPREQAEAQADAMKEAFEHNAETLVTREYLDSRLAAFKSQIDNEFASVRLEMGEMRGVLNLHSWMLGLLILTTTVPLLLKFLN